MQDFLCINLWQRFINKYLFRANILYFDAVFINKSASGLVHNLVATSFNKVIDYSNHSKLPDNTLGSLVEVIMNAIFVRS